MDGRRRVAVTAVSCDGHGRAGWRERPGGDRQDERNRRQLRGRGVPSASRWSAGVPDVWVSVVLRVLRADERRQRARLLSDRRVRHAAGRQLGGLVSDDLALNRERLLQNRTAREQAQPAIATMSMKTLAGLAAPLLPGSSVFDSVYGTDGTVEAVNQLRPGGVVNVVVRLETGGLVVRGPEHLIVGGKG